MRIPSSRAPGSEVRAAEFVFGALVLVLLFFHLPAAAPDGPLPRAEDLSLRLDLNRADWQELVALPGIGEKRARAIVSHRQREGPFSAPSSLTVVPGIGPVTVEGLLPFLRGE